MLSHSGAGSDPNAAKARDAMKQWIPRPGILLILLALSGCGGSKVLKEPTPLVVKQSLARASDQGLDFFLPLTPSPRQIELNYVDASGDHTQIVDTQTAPEGLHLIFFLTTVFVMEGS